MVIQLGTLPEHQGFHVYHEGLVGVVQVERVRHLVHDRQLLGVCGGGRGIETVTGKRHVHPAQA